MPSVWNKRLFRSLGFRISLWYALGFIASFALLGALAVWMIADSGRRADRAEVRAEFDEDAALCRQPGGTEAFRGQIAREPTDLEPTFIRLSEADGRTLLLRAPAGPREDGSLRWLEEQLRADRVAGWRELPTRDRAGRWQVYGEPMPDGRWLEVAKGDQRQREMLEDLGRVLPVVALGVVLLALPGAAALTARALRPVRRLIDTTRTVIAAGDMTARVPARSAAGRGDELDELSGLFNQMLARNEALIRGMREALDHVGHDLRTPLTRLHAAAEAALQRTDGTPEHRAERQAEALADAIEESRRALDMLGTLTDISQAEHGTMRLRPESLPLTPLATTAADLYEFEAEEKAVHIHVEVPPEIRVFADRVRLQQILANLLSNAVKYSRPGGDVRVGATVEEATGQVRLTVRDHGIGIPAAELPRIWERLYRGDNSRSQPGSGLGLSLVRAVVEAHGGRVEVVSQPDVGSTFSVLFARG